MLAPLQKIHVDRGCMVTYYEAHDLPGSAIRVEQRIHGVDPSISGTWRGYLHYPNRLVICVGQSLVDYTFDKDPTPESNEYDAGYRRGYGGKRALTADQFNAKSSHFCDGYQTGRFERQRYRKESEGR